MDRMKYGYKAIIRETEMTMKRTFTGQRTFVPLDDQGQELISYDNPSFPCSLIVSDVGKLRTKSVPWHWHDDVEIAIVTEGSSIIRVNDASYILREGDGYFMNRNVLHSQKLNEGNICKTTALIFSPGIFSGGIGSRLYMDLVLPILVNIELDFVPFHPDVDWEQRAIDCVHKIEEIYAEGSPGAELIICAVLAQFWHLLINGSSARFHNTKTLSMRNRKRIKAMIAYIENHYEEPITLADIAAAANVSARECTRCFNSIIGETPIVYLMKHRISVAAEQLIDPDCTVTEAAVSSGFDNLSYFAKIFKRYMNVTPRVYQKQINFDAITIKAKGR